MSEIKTLIDNTSGSEVEIAPRTVTAAIYDENGNTLQSLLDAKVSKSGDTMTGDLTLATGYKLNGALDYTTTAPTAANTTGVKICVLSSEPATKYSGWLYFITN